MNPSSSTIQERLASIRTELPQDVTLVAVSKTKPIECIEEALATNQFDFGENRVQELQEKEAALPKTIRWHQIGHLQTNKVKAIVPFVHLIHAVDSDHLLKEINRRAKNFGRTVDILLQVHIAQEDVKYGWKAPDLERYLDEDTLASFDHVRVRGLMGMATFTPDQQQIAQEFNQLRRLYDSLLPANPSWDTLSMGMSGDWRIAVDEGSTMIRVGSSIFGGR
ncbi:MAG: YggS family pyridoxal phosphate-dependent enzyme [Bacteroidetes bacterium]|jgi:PLP dependent protein|nr:YggS family pyridoxal phosphate-dependent enzyme [Bacteroidota bacterium]